MSRTGKMAQLLRLARIAAQSEQTGQSASEAIERAAEQAATGREGPRDAGRRRFTQGAVAGAVSAAAGAGAMSPVALAGMARIRRTVIGSGGGVAVVGAGIAGLSCAYELGRHGIETKVYEASGRVGGRCFSVRDVFPGQVAERGAEYIGATHHTMLGYARAFGLQLEDFSMLPGSTRYHFGSGSWSEAQVVEEFRAFASAMREDFALLGHPTAERFTPAEETFDLMSLDDYLVLNGAGDLLRKVIGTAYAAEYGAGIDQLSALGFLRFVHGDKRGKYAQIGAFGGEGFHVVDGNDRIASELAARLSAPVQLGHRLVAIRKLASGKVRLSFDAGGRRLQSDHDAVVLALPFSVLRDVQLDPTLELPAWKRYAIDHSAMGDGTRLMVGFKQPYWYLQHGSNGSAYSDVVRPLSTWESNPFNGNETRAVLSAQIGGAAGRAMDPRNLQAEARGFLNELELSMPGANVHALRTGTGDVVAAMHNWSLSPLSKGAYTCHRPGYFTTIAHNEGKAVGNVMFAGEHTSSFYEWQGFMEGAALSGLRAAGEVLAQARTTTSRRANAYF